MYALLLRGHSPADVEGKTLASKQKHLLQLAESAGNRRRNKCRDYAVNFWLNLMRLQDYMPNDNKLVLRGPGYGFLHEHVYKPPALKAGMYFSYKRFMSCVPEGLRLVGVELKEKHGDMDADKLRFGRCEKHSKFSECTKCQDTREEYLKALGNPEASQNSSRRSSTPCSSTAASGSRYVAQPHTAAVKPQLLTEDCPLLRRTEAKPLTFAKLASLKAPTLSTNAMTSAAAGGSAFPCPRMAGELQRPLLDSAAARGDTSCQAYDHFSHSGVYM